MIFKQRQKDIWNECRMKRNIEVKCWLHVEQTTWNYVWSAPNAASENIVDLLGLHFLPSLVQLKTFCSRLRYWKQIKNFSLCSTARVQLHKEKICRERKFWKIVYAFDIHFAQSIFFSYEISVSTSGREHNLELVSIRCQSQWTTLLQFFCTAFVLST